jgi:hypothetical protein
MTDTFEPTSRFVQLARSAALLGGGAALMSLAMVLGGEIARGEAFMGSSLAVAAGWLSFVAACLLVLGLAGVAVRFVPFLSGPGSIALAVLVVATAVTAGAASTLALVVPTLVERAPAIATDPPAAVPASFIFSGLVMGVCGIVLAVALRRALPHLPGWTTPLLIIASVVTIVPLPSRYFLLAFAVAALLGVRVAEGSAQREGVSAGRASA